MQSIIYLNKNDVMRHLSLKVIISLLCLCYYDSLFSQVTQNSFGQDSWIGHVYDGESLGSYKGYYNQTETFYENFIGIYSNFPVTTLAGGQTNVYTETFSVRYRMQSSKIGCYRVDLTGDDGIRLNIDGVWVFNRWVLQSPTNYNNILINFVGNSQLIYDFYERGGQNVAAFRNLVKLNQITSNTELAFCPGGRSTRTITANALPVSSTDITYTYQWQYREEGGAWQNISNFVTETSCRLPDLTNTTDIDKVYYFRRRVIFSQVAKWGATAKQYIDESASVKVILYGVPDVSIEGGNVCTGNELVHFIASKSGKYSFTIYIGDQPYNFNNIDSDSNVIISLNPTESYYSLVLTEVVNAGSCIVKYSNGNEPDKVKTSLFVKELISTGFIVRE